MHGGSNPVLSFLKEGKSESLFVAFRREVVLLSVFAWWEVAELQRKEGARPKAKGEETRALQ